MPSRLNQHKHLSLKQFWAAGTVVLEHSGFMSPPWPLAAAIFFF